MGSGVIGKMREVGRIMYVHKIVKKTDFSNNKLLNYIFIYLYLFV